MAAFPYMENDPVSAQSSDALFAQSALSDQTFDLSSLPRSERGSGTYSLFINTSQKADWQSSNTNVVSVTSFNNGKEGCLTIKSAGESTVTAVNWNGETLSAKITVTDSSKNSQTAASEKALYSYELRKLKETDLYAKVEAVTPYRSKYGDSYPRSFGKKQYILVLTDNPRFSGTEFALYNTAGGGKRIPLKNERTIFNGYTTAYKFPARPSELRDGTISDIDNIPDMLPDGRYVYIIGCEFDVVGTYTVKVQETDQNGRLRYTDNTWTFKTADPSQAYLKWLNESISTYTTEDMNVHEKMTAITKALQDKAVYDRNTSWDDYNYHTSLRIRTLPYWQSYYWDSAYTYPMQDIGALLDYKLLSYSEAGKSYYAHAEVFGEYEGKSYSYTICPPTRTSKPLSEYCPQIQLTDFEEIAKS